MKTFDLHRIRGPGQGKSLAFLFASVCRFEQKVLLTLRQVNLTILFLVEQQRSVGWNRVRNRSMILLTDLNIDSFAD